MSHIEFDHRFSKNRRLLTAAQFQNVFDHVNCKQSGKYFTFLSTSNQQANHRLGLVIAKKHIRLAVNRNKVKRAVRETFRLLAAPVARAAVETDAPEAALTSAFDVIVLAKSSANKLNNSQLNQELNRQWLLLIEKRKKL